MDLGDIIVPLVLIGGAILQWWSSRKAKPAETQEPDLFEEEYRRDFQPEPSSDPHLDDLMEALGQKPKADSFPENRIPPPPPPLPPVVIPRPIPRVIPEPPAYVRPPQAAPAPTPVPVNYFSHEEDQEKRFARFSSFDVEDAVAAEKLPPLIVRASKASQQNRWRQDLHSRTSLRKAIVLNEILQPPVALR